MVFIVYLLYTRLLTAFQNSTPNLTGAILDSFTIDAIGPKQTTIFGLVAQAIVRFMLSGLHAKLAENIVAAVVHGIFLSLGNVGPGNNFGLLASKSGPTSVRSQYYGTAVAVWRAGAFARAGAFSHIIDAFWGNYHDREHWVVLDLERAGVVVGCARVDFFCEAFDGE